MNKNIIDIHHMLYLSEQIAITKSKMENAATDSKKQFYLDQIQALQNTLEKIKSGAF